jgi:TP901 family phage tail tape measure protein
VGNESVTTSFKVDIAELKKEFTEARRQIQLANSEFKAATGGMDDWTKSADGLSAKLKQLDGVLEAQKTQLESLEKQYELVVKEQGADSKGAEELRIKINNQKAAIGNTERQIQTYTQQLADMGEENKKADELTQKMTDATDAFGDALKGLVANVLAAAITKLKELATEALTVGQAFDTSMSKVKAISGAAGEEYDQLREKAKEMGSQTKFTATQAADAFSYMAMAGWKTEDMLDGIDGVMSLAAASGADLATTSDIVTDALTAMGYSAEDAGHLADVMAAAAANSNTNVQLMGETFKYAAPLVGAMGYSMEDTAVAIGLMANAGVKGTQAGTALRGIMTRLVSPTKQSGEAMSALGIEIEKTNADGTKSMKSLGEVMNDLRDIFGNIQMPVEEFNEELKKLEAQQETYNAQLEAGEITEKKYEKLTGELAKSETELMKRAYGSEGALKGQYAAMLAGKNALSGFLAIVNASDEDFAKLTTAINNSDGAAQSMADTMLDNLGGDMTLLQSKVESVQLAFYEKLAPALREGVEILSQFIDTFADELGGAVEDFVNEVLPKILEGLHWIIENLPTIEALIVGIGTAWATWQVVGLITAITTALEGMTAAEVLLAAKQWLLNTAMAANPIGAIITLIAGLVAAFVVLWNKSDAFRQFWYDFGDSILEVWEDVVDGVTQWIDDLVWAWGNAIKSIKDWFSDIVAFWENVGKKLKNGAKDVWESVKDTFGAVADYFGNIFGKAWQKVKDVFSTGGKIFDGIKDGIVESFKEIVNGIIRAINKIVAIPFNAINKILDKIHDIEIAGVMPFEWVNTFDVPKIPELARGGVLKRGQLGLLEGNGSEAVVPLEKNTGWLDEIANRLHAKMSTQGGGVGAPAQNVTNNFYQTNNSPKALSRLEIYRQSKNLLRMKG